MSVRYSSSRRIYYLRLGENLFPNFRLQPSFGHKIYPALQDTGELSLHLQKSQVTNLGFGQEIDQKVYITRPVKIIPDGRPEDGKFAYLITMAKVLDWPTGNGNFLIH